MMRKLVRMKSVNTFLDAKVKLSLNDGNHVQFKRFFLSHREVLLGLVCF